MKSPTNLAPIIAACVVGAIGGYLLGHHGASPTVTSDAKSAGKTASSTHKAASASMPASEIQNLTLADFLNMKGKPDAALLMEWARGLDPSERKAALSQLAGMAAGLPRDAILDAVVDAFADGDPQGFLAASTDLKVPHLRETGVDTALKSWAEKDPQAAMQWVKDNSNSVSTTAEQNRFAAAIAGMAGTDPKGAFDTVTALSDDSPHDRMMKDAALKTLSDSLADQGNFNDALSMFNSLPAGQAQSDALTELAKRWAAASPQDASAWVASLTDPQQRAAMGTNVVASWAASDPAAAATWAAQMDQQSADPNQPGVANGQLLASAIQAWAADDFDGPGQFLNTLPDSPTKDNAVGIFALHTSQEDPEAALKWVSTIGNEQTRQGITFGVALQYMQQDPAGFSQYISTTTDLPDQMKQILTNIPPDAIKAMNQMNGATGGNFIQQMMENALINGPPGGGAGFGGPPGGDPNADPGNN